MEGTGLRRNRNFLLLWGGNTFSDFGDFFGQLAMSWLIYTNTESLLSLGLTWVVFLLPRSVVRLYFGVYVDRLDRRTVMIVTTALQGVVFLLLALAALHPADIAPAVYTSSFFIGLLGAIFDLASSALLPQIVDSQDLTRANSSMEASTNADAVLGPGAAGVTIALFGTPLPLAFDAVSFFVLVAALLFIRLPPPPPRKTREGTWWSEFKEGWVYFKNHSELLWLASLVAGINFALGGYWYVYALVYSDRVLLAGATGYGLLSAFSAFGTVVTSVYVVRTGIARKRRAVVVSMMVIGFWILLLSLARTLPLALAIMLLYGASVTYIDVTASAYYQKLVPNDFRGRVFAFRYLVNYITVPAGILFAVFAGTYLSIVSGIAISGAVVLAFGVSSIYAKALRILDEG